MPTSRSCLALTFLIAVLSFHSVTALGQIPSETRTLTVGTPIERSVGTSEAHRYAFDAEKGLFLKVRISHLGLRLSGDLYDPEGGLVKHYERNPGEGRMVFAHVAEKTGRYRLVVSSAEQKSESDRYTVTLERLAVPIQNDVDFMAGLRFFEEGKDVFHPRDAASTPKAIELFQAALDHFKRTDDINMMGESANQVGYCWSTLGDKAKAAEFYEVGIRYFETAGVLRGVAAGNNNLASCRRALGEFQKALDAYERAVSLWRRLGEKRSFTTTLNNLGSLHLELGEDEKALACFQEAKLLQEGLKDDVGLSVTLTNIGTVLTNRGEYGQAAEVLERALKLIDRFGENRRRAAKALMNLGNLYVLLSRLELAERSFRESLELSLAVGDRLNEGFALSELGRVSQRLGKFGDAAKLLDSALEIARSLRSRDLEAKTLLLQAKTLESQNDLAGARSKTVESLKIAEELRTGLADKSRRASYFTTLRQSYQYFIDLLLKSHAEDPDGGFDVQAFETVERSRARVLLELIAEADIDFQTGVDAELLRNERILQKQLNAEGDQLVRLLGGSAPGEQIAESEKRWKTITDQLESLRTKIRRQSPEYAALTQPEPFKLDQVRELLDNDTLLLEFHLGEKQSRLWIVGKDSFAGVALPPRTEIEAATSEFRLALLKTVRHSKPVRNLSKTDNRRGGMFQLAGAELGRLILEPAATLLTKKRLVIVSDGALQSVPFAALPLPKPVGGSTGTRFMVERFEISVLPSASTLGVLRGELGNRPPAGKTLTVFADPVFQRQDVRVRHNLARMKTVPDTTALNVSESGVTRSSGRRTTRLGSELKRLVFTREEATGILSLLPPDEVEAHFDFDANFANALSSNMRGFRYLHFATHGVFDDKIPELSGIVLSQVDELGRERSGFLGLGDIFNLRLDADLVVLSACQTALGQEKSGEGVIGLTRGFMYAGSPRIVASLWMVDDRATSELMRGFYRHLFGAKSMSPSAALREAQLAMLRRKNRNAPYYWAAFQLYGEWR